MRSVFWWLVLLAALLAILRPGRAEAYQPRISWVHPATWTNGLPLAPSQITGTEIQYGTCVGTAFGTLVHAWTLQGIQTQTVGPNLQPGTVWCYRLRTLAGGQQSDWSAVVRFTVPSSGCTPGCHGD